MVEQVLHSLVTGIVAAVGAADHVSRIPPASAGDIFAVSHIANIRNS